MWYEFHGQDNIFLRLLDIKIKCKDTSNFVTFYRYGQLNKKIAFKLLPSLILNFFILFTQIKRCIVTTNRKEKENLVKILKQ